MSFQTNKQDGVVVVDVDGQLIVGNRQELKQKVLDELESGERKFLIDFSNTGYIDSSGLGVLSGLSCWDTWLPSAWVAGHSTQVGGH